MLIRALVFLALLFGVGWLIHTGSQQPGMVVVQWYGYEISTSAVFLSFISLVLGMCFFLGGRIWSFFLYWPEKWRLRRQHEKQEKGYRYLMEGMEAAAEGDAAAAIKLADKAARKLPGIPLIDMLKAEAAHLSGDEEKAAEHFRQLSGKEKTAFLGVRGLLSQAYRKRQWHDAYIYACKVYDMKPKSSWAIQMLFDVLLHTQRFEEVAELLPAIKKAKVFPEEQYQFHYAAISLRIAMLAVKQKDFATAEKKVNSGLGVCPDFLPLALFKAEMLLQQGEQAMAEKTLAAFWKKCPRRDVFQKWLDIAMMQEGCVKVLKKAKTLSQYHDEHPVGALCFTEACMRMEEYEEAHKSLQKALESKITSLTYQYLAAVEEKRVNKDMGKAYTWLQESMNAPAYEDPDDGHATAYNTWCQTYLGETPSLHMLGSADQGAILLPAMKAMER